MSLINQMLKDLEVRSLPITQTNDLLTGLQSTTHQPKRNKKHYGFFLGLLALIAIWTWNLVYYINHHHSIPAVTQAQVQAVKRATTPVNVPAKTTSSTEPNTALTALSGISMQVHGKMTYLRFLLNHETFYQVNADPLQHSLTITLKNTQLTVNVPPLDFTHSALTDLKVAQSKDELQVVLLLNPDAKLSNLELNKETLYPELQADFLMEIADNAHPLQTQAIKESDKESKGQLKKVAVELQPEEKYQEALSLVQAGEIEKAVAQLALLLQQHPAYHLARETLMTLLIQQGDLKKAQALLNAGLMLHPYYPPFIEMQAHFLVDGGEIEQALTLLKKAPPALAVRPEYYAFMAALYQRLGRFASAENIYQQLTALHPEKGVWWLGLAVTEEGLGKNAQALDAYAKADRSPDLDPELRGYVGSRLRG